MAETRKLSGLFQQMRGGGRWVERPEIPFHINLVEAPHGRDVADRVGAELRRVLDDPGQPLQVKQHAAYYMAQVHEVRNEWDRVAEMLDFAGIGPGRDDSDGYDWAGHHRWIERFERVQDDGIRRGVPAIYINSLPQSGSSFLSAVVTSAFAVDRCRTTRGQFMAARVIPAWLAKFARGGASTHEHFKATPQNMSALEAAGISEITVQVRRPRAAMLSGFQRYRASVGQANYPAERYMAAAGLTPADLRDDSVGMLNYARVFLGDLVEFLETWRAYSVRPDAKVKAHFTRYEDQIRDPVAFYRGVIARFAGADHKIDVDAIVGRLQAEALSKGAHNFHGRQSNRLLDRIDERTREVVASLIRPDLLEFYGYEPV